jgi:hypothetical protein
MKLDSSIAAPILIGSPLAASSPPPALFSSPPPADSLVSAASVDSLLELEPPPPHAARATLIAKTKIINPNFENGDLKVLSSYMPTNRTAHPPPIALLPLMRGKLPPV